MKFVELTRLRRKDLNDLFFLLNDMFELDASYAVRTLDEPVNLEPEERRPLNLPVLRIRVERVNRLGARTLLRNAMTDSITSHGVFIVVTLAALAHSPPARSAMRLPLAV